MNYKEIVCATGQAFLSSAKVSSLVLFQGEISPALQDRGPLGVTARLSHVSKLRGSLLKRTPLWSPQSQASSPHCQEKQFQGVLVLIQDSWLDVEWGWQQAGFKGTPWLEVSSGSGIPTELTGSSSWSQECRVWLQRERVSIQFVSFLIRLSTLLIGKVLGVVLLDVWWDVKWHDCLWSSLLGSLQEQKFKWWWKVHFQEWILFSLQLLPKEHRRHLVAAPWAMLDRWGFRVCYRYFQKIFFFLPEIFDMKIRAARVCFFSHSSVRGCLFKNGIRLLRDRPATLPRWKVLGSDVGVCKAPLHTFQDFLNKSLQGGSFWGHAVTAVSRAV